MVVGIMLLLFIVGLIWSIFSVRVKRARFIRRNYGMKRADFNKLSWPSKQIVKHYFELPVSNRPFDNLLGILKALDIKHSVNSVNEHFVKNRSYYDIEPETQSWKNGCRGCGMCNDYVNLCHGLKEIKNALDEQAHAIQIASISDQLWAGKIAIERMNEEREIIRRVTKEITA